MTKKIVPKKIVRRQGVSRGSLSGIYNQAVIVGFDEGFTYKSIEQLNKEENFETVKKYLGIKEAEDV